VLEREEKKRTLKSQKRMLGGKRIGKVDPQETDLGSPLTKKEPHLSCKFLTTPKPKSIHLFQQRVDPFTPHQQYSASVSLLIIDFGGF